MKNPSSATPIKHSSSATQIEESLKRYANQASLKRNPNEVSLKRYPNEESPKHKLNQVTLKCNSVLRHRTRSLSSSVCTRSRKNFPGLRRILSLSTLQRQPCKTSVSRLIKSQVVGNTISSPTIPPSQPRVLHKTAQIAADGALRHITVAQITASGASRHIPMATTYLRYPRCPH